MSILESIFFGKINNSVLAIDIGDQNIRIALLKKRGKKIKILKIFSQRHKIDDINNGVIMNMENVIDECQNLIDYASLKGNIGSTVISMSTEYTKSIITNISLKRKYPPKQEISQKEIKNIIGNLQWKSSVQARKKMADEMGFAEIDVKLISTNMISMEIDGKKVYNPIGFSGKEISVSIFTSFMPLFCYNKLQNLASNLSERFIEVGSTQHSIASIFSFGFGKNEDIIFVDIGRNTTDVFITKNGNIIWQKSFSIGGKNFTTEIMNDLNIDFFSSEKIKIKYQKDSLTKKSREIVKKNIDKIIDIWMIGFKIVLKDFVEQMEENDINIKPKIPSNVFLCGATTKISEIKKSLFNKKWRENMNFDKKDFDIKFCDFNLILQNKLINKTKQKNLFEFIPCISLAISKIMEREIDSKSSVFKMWKDRFFSVDKLNR